MTVKNSPSLEIRNDLIEAIRTLPIHREIEHCGVPITIGVFDFYATCPRCGTRIKVRSFAATPELEDIFDVVFEWMNQPGADEVARHRRETLASGD